MALMSKKVTDKNIKRWRKIYLSTQITIKQILRRSNFFEECN